jgi:hypothetical protein
VLECADRSVLKMVAVIQEPDSEAQECLMSGDMRLGRSPPLREKAVREE